MTVYYVSNIRRNWPPARQLAMFAPGTVYEDRLTPSVRKSCDPLSLENRARMLKSPHTEITVASLTVLAWTAGDLLEVLVSLTARRATLVSLYDGLTVRPNHTGAAGAAIRAFQANISRGFYVRNPEPRGRRAAETIRARWERPDLYPNDGVLLAEAEISRPTATRYLGARPRGPAV